MGLRVNGQGRQARRVWVVVAFALAPMMIACPTVHRYAPHEGEPITYHPSRLPKTRPVRVTKPTQGTKPRPNGSSPLAAQLGDGSLQSELATGARRLVGFAFPERDVKSFVDHLMAVALWDGDKTAVSQPTSGDLWFGDGGRVAVVDAQVTGGAYAVIGPQRDGVIARFEVRGGRFWRATLGDVAN